MRYSRLKTVLRALVLLYMGAALVMGFSFYHRDLLPNYYHEVFPLFSWSLFSTVFERETDFSVQIHEMNGEALNPPIDFMTSKDLFPGAGSIRAYYNIQNLGVASLRRRGDDIERYRTTFEKTYLAVPGSSVEYAVFMRVFDPVERWRDGRVEQYRPVARYRASEESP